MSAVAELDAALQMLQSMQVGFSGREVSENTLRARRRIQTRTEIHQAAVELVLQRGFTEVTVEDIAQASGVSPRTFFNYFPTKQEAIFPGPPELDPENIEQFVAGTGPLLSDLRTLVANYAQFAPNVHKQMLELRPILAQQPEVWAHINKRFGDLENQFAQAIARRRNRAEPTSEDHVIAAVSAAVMRLSLRCWSRLEETESTVSLRDLIDQNFATIKLLASED